MDDRRRADRPGTDGGPPPLPRVAEPTWSQAAGAPKRTARQTAPPDRAASVKKRDVEADILGRLERFVAAGSRLPAMPAPEGPRVNVLALCRALGLPESDAQHFHRKEAVKAAVNALAAEQGLLGIGVRGAPSDAGEKKLEDRIKETNARAREADLAAEEASAARAVLVEELSAARAEIAALRTRNASLEERLRLVEEQGILFDAGSR